MSNKNLEKAIEKVICQYLDLKGCFPCKVETTGIFDPSKKTFRSVTNPYIRKGFSDIMFFWKNKVWYCEVKTPEQLGYIKRNWHKLEPGLVSSRQRITNQIEFLKQVRRNNQVGVFVSSLDELKSLMALDQSSVPFYLEG